ncbi:MiaB/RimO family radical SAM methylthiotransferase [Candidatus Gottesmanbacteria bacterium]|nr:MiaB/RimO family radical SAM methylthiotransferase [Candidatus Gottesmanbacteria bacterium]
MTKTFASFSFGCRVNQAEKEMLDRQLLVAGLQYSEKSPSLYIINTCAVTQKAEREARQLIYQTKRKWPQIKIVITGCAATKWINEGIKIPQADWLIDNVNKEYIASLLNSKFKIKNEKLQFKIQNYKNKFLNSGRLLLKIQDGCQRFCTFCIVPYLRGQPKSIPIDQLVKTINKFTYINNYRPETKYINSNKFLKEVILTAINTQAYGFDTGESLIALVIQITKATRIPRISFGSIHPWSINNEFFQFYESTLSHNRLVKFFHIPLQSGSNKILSLMKRGYTREEFIEKLKTLEKIHPLTFIGTDIIVGFLEETDRDFEDTYNFLKDSPISKFHVFRFSPREKTAAYFMKKRLKEPTPAEKNERAKSLIELSNKKYHKFLEKHVGITFPALFLERKIDGYQEVLLDNQIPAMIKTSKNLSGSIKTVTVDKMQNSELVGKLV